MMPAMSSPGELAPGSSRDAVRRALVAVCDIGCLVVLAYLVASRIFYAEFGVSLIFGVDRLVLLGVALGFCAVRLLAIRLNPRATLACTAFLSAVAVSLIVLSVAGVDVESPVRGMLAPVKARLFTIIFGTTDPGGLYRFDDRYGFVHVPGARTSQLGRRYFASYATDAEGNRVMPAPVAARSTVMFLGDSFTFGAGVNDDQTFPFVLATEHWTDVRVINAGVGGWGLTQFHLRLTDALAQRPFPTVVFVVIIPHDLRRSHLRPPIVPGISRRLEWIDGQWVPRTPVYTNPIVDDSPVLLEQEARQATATFTAMSALARAKNVEFAVILLDDDGEYPPDMVYALAQSGIPLLDLSRLGQTWIPYDTHPDPGGHRTIAGAIAASSLTELVYRRTAPPD
jgi:hypothetical protein